MPVFLLIVAIAAVGIAVAGKNANAAAAATKNSSPQRQTVSPTARPGMVTRSAIGWDDSGIGAQHSKTGPELPDNVPGKKRLLENEITKLDSVIAESVDPGHAFQFKTARERMLRQLSRINQVPFTPAKDLGQYTGVVPDTPTTTEPASLWTRTRATFQFRFNPGDAVPARSPWGMANDTVDTPASPNLGPNANRKVFPGHGTNIRLASAANPASTPTRPAAWRGKRETA
jgi:hypothetical protein